MKHPPAFHEHEAKDLGRRQRGKVELTCILSKYIGVSDASLNMYNEIIYLNQRGYEVNFDSPSCANNHVWVHLEDFLGQVGIISLSCSRPILDTGI